MLDLQPASTRPRHSRRRFGLALAGGGPFGAFYEVGALHAIGRSLRGTRPHRARHVHRCQLRARWSPPGWRMASTRPISASSSSTTPRGLPGGAGPVPAPRLCASTCPASRACPASWPKSSGSTCASQAGLGRTRSIRSAGCCRPACATTGRFERFLARLFESPGRSNDFRSCGTSSTSSRRSWTVATRCASANRASTTCRSRVRSRRARRCRDSIRRSKSTATPTSMAR